MSASFCESPLGLLAPPLPLLPLLVLLASLSNCEPESSLSIGALTPTELPLALRLRISEPFSTEVSCPRATSASFCLSPLGLLAPPLPLLPLLVLLASLLNSEPESSLSTGPLTLTELPLALSLPIRESFSTAVSCKPAMSASFCLSPLGLLALPLLPAAPLVLLASLSNCEPESSLSTGALTPVELPLALPLPISEPFSAEVSCRPAMSASFCLSPLGLLAPPLPLFALLVLLASLLNSEPESSLSTGALMPVELPLTLSLPISEPFSTEVSCKPTSFAELSGPSLVSCDPSLGPGLGLPVSVMSPTKRHTQPVGSVASATPGMRARVAADSATPAASILARCLSRMLKVLISVFPPFLQAF